MSRPIDLATPTDTLHRPARVGWLGVVLVAVATFVFILPTLPRMEFSGSMENLNIATVMELRRGGPWMIPRLEGADRVNKPPLTAWVTALAVPPALMPRLSDADDAARTAAYGELALRTRGVGLTETCLTVLLVGGIACAIGGGAAEMIASAAAYATCLMVLRLGRGATTDVMLTLWIAAAMLGVALWLWRGWRWRGAMLTGLAIGLAFMSKGPVSLLFIALPPLLLAIWAAMDWRRGWAWSDTPIGAAESGDRAARPPIAAEDSVVSRDATDAAGTLARSALGPGLAALLLTIVLASAIGLPWFLYVLHHESQVMAGWAVEATTIGASQDLKSKPYLYLAVIPLALPWLPWALAAMGQAIRDARVRKLTPAVWLTIAAVLPLCIMTFFPDRKDRYALPAMIPLALLTGIAWRHLVGVWRRRTIALHVIIMAVIAIGGLIGAATFAKTLAGRPWMTPGSAATAAVVLGVILIAGARLARRQPTTLIAVTVLILLSMQAIAIDGYRLSHDGKSELKPLADAIRKAGFADAELINGRKVQKRAPVDLAIYLNHASTPVRNWESLPPSDHARIVIVPQQHADAKPDMPPTWQWLAKTPRDNDWWWALVQLPANEQPATRP